MNRIAVAAVTVALLATPACDNSASGDNSKSDHSDPRSEKKVEKSNGKHKFKLGRIDSREITESSGLAASRKHPGVFWTHNDSGNGPYIFAITRDGHLLA